MTFDKTWKLIYAYSTLGIAAAFVLLILYWLIYPLKTLDVKGVASVDRKVVVAGDSLVYSFEYCRYTDKPAEITRQFIDDIIYTTEAITVIEKERCDERDVLVRIPSSLPPDRYHIKVISRIKVNPIKTITTEFITEEFEVVTKQEVNNESHLETNKVSDGSEVERFSN